jgi:small subunit ribosomal protein S7
MRKERQKKTTLPDPRFNDQLVTRFVNNLMWDGKKSTALKYFMMQLTL